MGQVPSSLNLVCHHLSPADPVHFNFLIPAAWSERLSDVAGNKISIYVTLNPFRELVSIIIIIRSLGQTDSTSTDMQRWKHLASLAKIR